MIFLPLLSLEADFFLRNVHLAMEIVQTNLSNVSRILHAIAPSWVILHFVRGLELLTTVVAFFKKYF